MTKTMATLLAAALAFGGAAVHAADATAQAPSMTKSEAKKENTESKAQMQAKGKVSEANETLNKADCENNMDGKAERACKKSATAQARSEKADAKTVRETQKKAIDEASKGAK